jgi:chorismate synthase
LTGNSIGKEFVVSSFGESHGKIVGVIIDGCPAGLALSESDIQADLDRRIPLEKPGLVSGRVEKDKVQILSGIFERFTTGAPICMIVENKQAKPSDYESLRNLPRPAHADYTAAIKYGSFNDYRGGGRFSGRVTVTSIMAGTLAKKLLALFGLEVLAYTKSIASVKTDKEFTDKEIKEGKYASAVRCPDLVCSAQMEAAIVEAQKAGDSVGGIVECIVAGIPVGVGEPLFDTLDGDLAKALFSVPAVKGVEFGAGFALAEMKGSEANDAFRMQDDLVSSVTNKAGGILGGISSGMPIGIRVAIKPTPSISQKQQTVDLSNRQDAEIKVGGRHDPCIVPKAVLAIEAAVAITIVDHMIRAGFIPKVIERQT